MIIYHQNNVGGFAGAHTWYWQFQPVGQHQQRVSITSAAAANQLIEQARSVARFTFTRLFGRIN